jgi:hypothetical protein
VLVLRRVGIVADAGEMAVHGHYGRSC